MIPKVHMFFELRWIDFVLGAYTETIVEEFNSETSHSFADLALIK